MQPLAKPAHLHTQCTCSSSLTPHVSMCVFHSLTQVGYELKVEGEITQQLVAQLDSSIDVGRVTFQQVCFGARGLGRVWQQGSPHGVYGSPLHGLSVLLTTGCRAARLTDRRHTHSLVHVVVLLSLTGIWSACPYSCFLPLLPLLLPLLWPLLLPLTRRVMPARCLLAWAPLMQCWPPTCCAGCQTLRPAWRASQTHSTPGVCWC